MQHKAQEVPANLQWVKTGEGDAYIIQAEPLIIHAAPEVIWNVMCDLNHYHEFSDGAITAQINSELKAGETIELKLLDGRRAGWFIPRSTETLTVVDEEHKVLCWQRALPFASGLSSRYHVLEALPDNQGTRSYIALHLPGAAGFFTSKLMKNLIKEAFDELHAGIKKRSEMQHG